MSNRWKSKELREFDKILRKNGWKWARCRGDHNIYRKGSRHMSVPGKCKWVVIDRLIKEYGLVV